MIKKVFFLAILFNLVCFSVFAEGKRYLMNINLLISDNVKKVVANYKFTKITTEGKPIVMNLRVSNMQVSLVFNLLSGDETSINLVSLGKVSLKVPVSGSLPAGTKPLSGTPSLSSDSAMTDKLSPKNKSLAIVAAIPKKTFPLKFGEKLLFFPLGVKNNGENRKISNCILEMEILPYDKIEKKLTEESDLLEPSKQQQTEKINS